MYANTEIYESNVFIGRQVNNKVLRPVTGTAVITNVQV